MKKDGTAGKGRALLRHLAVVLVFVLAAALVFTPIWVLGGRYAVSAVHDVQAKLPRADSDLQLTEQYDPQPNTFGIVEGATVTGGMHFGRLECSQIGLDCPVYYGAIGCACVPVRPRLRLMVCRVTASLPLSLGTIQRCSGTWHS